MGHHAGSFCLLTLLDIACAWARNVSRTITDLMQREPWNQMFQLHACNAPRKAALYCQLTEATINKGDSYIYMHAIQLRIQF